MVKGLKRDSFQCGVLLSVFEQVQRVERRGDPRQAKSLEHGRLGRAFFGLGVPGHRFSLWYLAHEALHALPM